MQLNVKVRWCRGVWASPKFLNDNFLHLFILSFSTVKLHVWCTCVVTLYVLTQGVCEATVAPLVSTHMCRCMIVCFFVHTFACVCLCAHWCVCTLPDLCYSLSIVKESVEQDPDPPAGTNQTHSSGLNGQLTIREPLWPRLLVRHS